MQTLAEVGLERDGQIISGYDAAHDDEKNGGGEMISAAISVLRHTRGEIANDKFGICDKWKGNNRRLLIIAAALLVAEIDRLDRITDRNEALKGVPEIEPKPQDPAAKLLKWFSYQHLAKEEVRAVSRRFSIMAQMIIESMPPCAERTACMRKLLEAKDCAVRATLDPS